MEEVRFEAELREFREEVGGLEQAVWPFGAL